MFTKCKNDSVCDDGLIAFAEFGEMVVRVTIGEYANAQRHTQIVPFGA